MRKQIAIGVIVIIGFTQVACALSLLGVHFLMTSLMPEQWEIAAFMLIMALCVLSVNFLLVYVCFMSKRTVLDILKDQERSNRP